MNKFKYSLIIPTLEEKENITILLRNIESLNISTLEIIVVDENSKDGTAEAVETYSSGRESLRCIKNGGLPGLSRSIVLGFENAHGEFLLCMDGDLQHDVNGLKKLIDTLETADFAVGSRYAEGGGFAERWNLIRVMISRTASIMARLLLGVNVSDPMSGFFGLRKSVFDAVRARLNPEGFKIMLEILYILVNSKNSKYSIKETGIIFRKRIYGRSKLNFRVILSFITMIRRLRKIDFKKDCV